MRTSWTLRIDIELKNYRCFPDESPARFVIRDGFVSFVGVNNAGKSSVLRFLFELRDLFRRLGTTNSGETLGGLRGSPIGFNPQGLADYIEIFNDTNDRDLTITFRCAGETPSGLPSPDRLEATIPRQPGPACTLKLKVGNEYLPPHDDLNFTGENVLGRAGPAHLADLTHYAKAFAALAESLYIGPFRNAINVGANESYYDLAVGQAFIEAWNNFKTGGSRATANAAIALTEDIRRIFGFESLEINATAGRDSLQVVIDRRPYRLHELGGGIAHFIIVLAYVATRTPAFLVIDEPELNLHPSLQLDFLTTLGGYTSEGVVFATHSIGLAKAGSQAIYSVRRLGQGRSQIREYEATTRLAEFVGELSFAGYQELGVDKLLLVEGPSDVTAFQRLLRLYSLEHQILLVPLGGATLINAGSEAQLLELKRITEHVYALVDSERNAEGAELDANRAGFVRACEAAGVTCNVLDRRALENYWTDRAVKLVKGPAYRALAPYERLQDVAPAWAKAENWKIAGEIDLAELNATDLGTFFQTLA